MSTKSDLNPLVFNEESGTYRSNSVITKDDILETARSILSEQIRQSEALTSPDIVTKYLVTQFAGLEHEIFACLFLDNRHRVIRYEEMFRGTIDGCSVHPREVVKAALAANAAAVILAHNHPAGPHHSGRSGHRIVCGTGASVDRGDLN